MARTQAHYAPAGTICFGPAGVVDTVGELSSGLPSGPAHAGTLQSSGPTDKVGRRVWTLKVEGPIRGTPDDYYLHSRCFKTQPKRQDRHTITSQLWRHRVAKTRSQLSRYEQET